MTVLYIIIGVFVGYVLLHPQRRKNFVKSLDVKGFKEPFSKPEEDDGNSNNQGRRSNKG